MAHISVSREIGGRTLTLETGKVAKLATSAVIARYGDSALLASCMRANPREGLDFFPLQIDYREKTAAAGKFPGGFKKREGPPSEKEVLTMRMIDRPIRPLFPDGFIDEVQIQCWVMSHDGENDTDVIAGTAASAALAISNAPFEGPTATVRVARVFTDDGPQFVINPTVSQMEFSDLDLVLAGHKDGVNMIEVGAAEVAQGQAARVPGPARRTEDRVRGAESAGVDLDPAESGRALVAGDRELRRERLEGGVRKTEAVGLEDAHTVLQLEVALEDHLVAVEAADGEVVGGDVHRGKYNVFGTLQAVGDAIGKRAIRIRKKVRALNGVVSGSALYPVCGLPGGVSKPVIESARAVLVLRQVAGH